MGKMGNDPVHGAEYENARAEWEMLTKQLRFLSGARSRWPTAGGLFQLSGMGTGRADQSGMGAGQANECDAAAADDDRREAKLLVSQIEPTTYLLLLREARKMDILPGRDAIQRR